MTDSGCQIRLASADDAAAIAKLMPQLGYQTSETHLANWLAQAHPGCSCWVACQQELIGGVVALQLLPLLHNDEVLARVTALVVDQSCRGQGMAARLLAKAEETARLHGAVRMEITSSNFRQDAHAFYRKHGYAVPDVTRFIKTL